MLATLVAVNMNPIVDPGPLAELVNPVLASRNPSARLYEDAAHIRARAAAGASEEELQTLAEEFTAAPESVSALYQLMPEHFVWLYGSESFEGLLPPNLGQVTPKAIEPSMLNAQGRAALAALRTMRAGPPSQSP
jgi:hypothetical protein